MTGLVRKATLLTFCGLMLAGAAMAGVPSAANSLLPPSGNFTLGPARSGPAPGAHVDALGAPDNYFQFTITVKDLGSFAVSSSDVSLDFSACHHLFIGGTQPAITAVGGSVDCIGHKIHVPSNSLGVALFNIIGASDNAAGGTLPSTPTVTARCCHVKADTQDLGDLGVITVDMDNAVGVGSADLGAESADVNYSQTHLPQFFERADMEGDFDDDSADLGKEVDIYINILVATGHDGPSCGDNGSCCSVLP